jgi:hypothetical protein
MTCHLTCDDEAGPFQWTRAQSPFFLDGGPDILHFPTWAPRWGPFLLVALHKGAAAMVKKRRPPATASALGVVRADSQVRTKTGQQHFQGSSISSFGFRPHIHRM